MQTIWRANAVACSRSFSAPVVGERAVRDKTIHISLLPASVIVMKSSDNVCTVVENIQPGSVIWAGAVQVEYIA
jgi:hypothetical protein